jgi:predicted AlkP superfamily phosphohydrolase/phosphomutase
MVSGMHTPSLDKGVSPKTLFNEIIDRFPQYQIDVMSYWFDSYDIFLKNLNKMTAARMQTAEYLYKKYKPELFLLVLVAADRVQHALWGQMAHPSNGNNKSNWKYSRSVLGVYQQMDKFLNRIISLLDGDTALIVMSDHGFGSLKKDVYLNNFLIKSGFLTLKDNKWKKPFDWRKPFANIDWKSTKAYSYGLFGNIFINLKGREPRGIVNTGSQYEDVINSLINRLKTLKDPEDGEKIVTKVYRREELYHGPYLDEAPDLLICMKDYSYIARGGQEFSEQSLVSKPKINHSGNHRMNGVAFFLGPFIKKRLKLPDINIVDLCPTVLSIMGLPVPDDMDGRVVNEVFEKDVVTA